MAEYVSGSKSTNKYDGRYYQFVWSASQSAITNTSTITWSLKAVGGEANWYAERTVKLVVAGTTVYSKSDRVERKTGTITSGTTTIKHDNDGKASFSVSIQAAVYTSSVNLKGSATFNLKTIPRGSTISAINGTTIGGAMALTIQRNNTLYTHSLWYRIKDKAWSEEKTNIGTSYNLSLPLSLLNDMTNSSTGVLELRLRTYSGATQIGSDMYKNVTVSAPSYVTPTFSSISCEEAIKEIDSALGVFVQNRSKLNLAIVGAKGSYGSTIKEYLIEVDGQKITTQSGTTNIISSNSDITLKAQIIDSRGFSHSLERNIYVYPYNAPTLSNVEITRDTNSATIIATANCSSIIKDDVELNEFSYKVRIKKRSSSTWNEIEPVSIGAISKDLNVVITGLEPNSSYDIEIYAMDKISVSSAYILAVPTETVFLDKDVRNSRIAMGKTLEYDDSTLEVLEETILYVGEKRIALKDVLCLNENGDLFIQGNIVSNNLNDTGWVEIDLGSDYTPYGETPPQIRKIGNIVKLRGTITNTSNVTFNGSQVIATIPEQFRPIGGDERQLQQGSGSYRYNMTVTESGNILFDRYSNDTTMRKETVVNSWLNMFMTWFI